jgi:hypothetical protein
MLKRFSVTQVLVLFAALAIATLIPAWRGPGWPLTHEGAAFAQRTFIYARHYSWLDVLPLWTNIDALGFGSPMLVVYHKLFYMISGPLALATGSMKVAIVIAVALLLTVGAFGMYMTMRAMGASRLASVIAGCCLLTASYTVTNWLVRGAMAELAAAMVAVWVLFYFERSIAAGRLHVGLGITLGLVWLGHSVLAYFIGLVLGTTYLLLALLRMAPWSMLNLRTAWPAGASFACLVVPFLVPMAIFGPAYDFTRIVKPPYRPAYQFRPTLAYVWDTDWSAVGRKSVGLTVQLDHAMLVLLAVAICALAVMPVAADGRNRTDALKRVAPFVIIGSLCFILQLPITAAIYEVLPGGAFIQFPWRLLAFLTPALIIAAVYLADAALPGDARPFALGAAAVWMLVSCIAFAPMRMRRVPIDPPPMARVDFSYFREYEPKTARSLRTLVKIIGEHWAGSGCSYRIESGADEVPEVRFDVDCVRSAVLPLPLYASPLHMVYNSSYPRGLRCIALPDFAGVCGTIVPAGYNTVSVKLPSMAALPGWGWERAAAFFRSR